MKNILGISILIIAGGSNILAPETSPCPAISVSGGGIVHSGAAVQNLPELEI
jgi:hypothetical protein